MCWGGFFKTLWNDIFNTYFNFLTRDTTLLCFRDPSLASCLKNAVLKTAQLT